MIPVKLFRQLLVTFQMQDISSLPVKLKPAARKGAGIGKDPSTQTSFLPDKEREMQEEHMREQLKQEYELRQQVRFC